MASVRQVKERPHVAPYDQVPEVPVNEIMKIKIEMAGLGWDIQEKISGDGWRNSTGYNIWLKRSDWHGKFTYTLTGHEVVFHAHEQDASNYEAVLKAVKRAANRAKQAWAEFPNAIPCQNAKGEIIKDVMFFPFEEGKDVRSVSMENKERANCEFSKEFEEE